MSSLLDTAVTVVDRLWPWFVLLGTVLLVLVAWRVLWRLQAKHHEADSHGKTKVLVAIVASLALGFGGFYLFNDFEAGAREKTHDTMVKKLNLTIGEGDYLEAVKVAASKPTAIGTNEQKIAVANQTLAAIAAGTSQANPILEQENLTAGIEGLAAARKDLHDAQVKIRQLTPNHLLWLRMEPLLEEHRDEEARALLLQALDATTVTQAIPAQGDDRPCERDTEARCNSPFVPMEIEYRSPDSHGILGQVPVAEAGPAAFANQEEFNAQRDQFFRWFVTPGVTGLFLAPFAFVGGHLLAKAYEPSSSVGFKKYPGKSAGWFLLLGAFGIFAIPFGAWVLRDLHKRTIEGQIAL